MRPGGAESLVGTVLSGRYRIEKLIGEGGMAVVYEAQHTLMRKRLAVKVLHPEMSRMPEVVTRFEREAMAAAHIEHPNVAAATDFGKLDDGSFFLVLEYVEGPTLREVIAEGRLELGRALHISRQIAAALSRAHGLGIVHRDLKPENIKLVERDGDPDFVKVLDFGIAKVPVGELASTAADPKQPVLTQMGMVYGTPEYMAPEQALGQPVDPRADLYALGVMTYEMLTGYRPFEHESKVALLGMHVTAPVPPMSQKAPDANVPIDVEHLVVKLLAKESTARTQEARELIDGINAITAQLAADGRIDARFAGGPPLSTARPATASTTSEIGAPASAARAPTQTDPALGPARQGPPIIMTPPPLLSLADKRKLVPILAVGAGFGVLLIVLAVIIGRGGSGATVSPDAAVATAATSGASASSSAEPSIPPPPGEQVKEALALLDKGDFAAAADKLEALTGSDRERVDVRKALVRAYSGKKAYKEAMREAAALLAADPKLASDIPLATDIRDAALSTDKDGADDAFALLEAKMGEFGIDILYEMAFSYAAQYPVQAKRAQKVLTRPEVRARASAATQVNLDIRASAANPCNIKPMLERAKENGDAQTLALLKPLTGSKRCGFAGSRTCIMYPCLMSDGQLKDTIATIEARVAKKK
jgi:serine/threonine-protein kinase